MSAPRLENQLLLQAGRLLLEYNESTAAIHHALTATARTLTHQVCQVDVSYGGVAVSLGAEEQVYQSVPELRFNTAVQARVHEILDQVRLGRLDAASALACLKAAEAETPRHPRWQVAAVLGAAAASLAGLLGADIGAALVAGVATSLGLLARQELGRRHYPLLLLPLAASLIGALLGGLAIRLGWTQTPELVLVVPALMVVPGPHLINGLLDLIDNHLPMSLARLGLAAGIVIASAAGVVLGVQITLPDSFGVEQIANADRLNLASDMALAGIVTCGFALFYNTAWRHVWMAALGGMCGHGLRFLAIEAGIRLEVATTLGGLAVGIVSAWISHSRKVPVAVIGFAGAVTMIPGLHIYRALAGSLQTARLGRLTDAATMAETLGTAAQACLVIGGLALGLVIGARSVLALVRGGSKSLSSRSQVRQQGAGGPVQNAERPEITSRVTEAVALDIGGNQ